MKRENKFRQWLVLGFAIALLMPVYNTVLFGQNFYLTIFEHATLGKFLWYFWLVLIILMLYVINFQKKFIKIADWVFIVASALTIGIVFLGKTDNPFTFKYGLIIQIIVLVDYIFLKFAQDIAFKAHDVFNEYWGKVVTILQKVEVQEQEQPVYEEPVYESDQEDFTEEIVEEKSNNKEY